MSLLEIVSKVPEESFYVKETEVGARQYNPHMMLAVIIYAFMIGVFSSRMIALLVQRDDRFKYIAGRCTPSHTVICRFIRNNGRAISQCMEQILLLAFEMNLTTGENAGMDGSKFKANASMNENMTVEAIQAKLVTIEADIEACHELIAEQSTKETVGDQVSYGFNGDHHDNQLSLAFQELENLTKLKGKHVQALPPAPVVQVAPSAVKVSDNHDQKPIENGSSTSVTTLAVAIKSTSVNATKKQLKTLTRQKNKFERALVQATVDEADQAEYQFRKKHDAKHLRKLRQLQGGKMTTSTVSEVRSVTTKNVASIDLNTTSTSVPTVQPHRSTRT